MCVCGGGGSDSICRFEIKQPIESVEYLNTHHSAPKTLILSVGGGGGGRGDARGKNVSGNPAHQHQYITVGVNTSSFTRWSRIALVRVR